MPSNLFVVLMGLGTVFFGLICIILLSTVMSKVCQLFQKKEPIAIASEEETPAVAMPPAEAPATPTAVPDAIPDRQAMVAAISAAIAEDLGTDISGIRIKSLRYVGGAAPATAPVADRQAMIAAVSAAIAEDLGTDISSIRIHSFKRVA